MNRIKNIINGQTRWSWLLIFFWTLILILSFSWNSYQNWKNILEQGRREALGGYNKDLVYRRWNAQHGSVYVPVTNETQPNPYLSHIPNRDIITDSGIELTLMNPAYMTRQVHKLGQKQYGFHSHITSLNVIRPGNEPDEWEKKALTAFETTSDIEMSELTWINGQRFLRYMRPLLIEKSCLKCHASQGYKVGEIRGGISVSVPMAELILIFKKTILHLAGGHFILLILGVFGIINTSTKMSHLKELKQTEEQLRNINKELEQFAYVASHDLQEPLRMVSSYLQLLEKRYKDRLDDDAKEFIDFAVGGAVRMKVLINDLLQYSRIGTRGKPFEKLNAKTLLDQAVANLQIKIEKSNAQIVTDKLPEIYADENQIMRLLQNLIDNALKYRREETPIVHISAKRAEEAWIFSIKDNGIGMEEQYHNRIFEIFQRLHGKNEFSGTGIGLAICKKIVERHGGQIWLESVPGKGSTFYFSIKNEGQESYETYRNTVS